MIFSVETKDNDIDVCTLYFKKPKSDSCESVKEVKKGIKEGIVIKRYVERRKVTRTRGMVLNHCSL